MIRYFNSNRPILIFYLFLYTCVLNLVLFVYPDNFSLEETHAPFSELAFIVTGFLFNNHPYIISMISIGLVLLQGLLINQIFNDIKVFEKASYVPALVYITLASLFTDYLYLSPALIANTFVILIIGKALEFFRKQRCFMEIYDMGLLIGIASLFYFPVAVLVFTMFIALAIFRAFNWKEWMAGLSGFFTAYFLTGTYFFIVDRLPEFIENHILTGLISFESGIGYDAGYYIIAGTTIILTIAATALFSMNYLKSQIHIRKFFTLCGWVFLLLFFAFILKPQLSLNHFVILSVPLSVAIAYLLMSIERVWIADVIHGVWVITILAFQYF